MMGTCLSRTSGQGRDAPQASAPKSQQCSIDADGVMLHVSESASAIGASPAAADFSFAASHVSHQLANSTLDDVAQRGTRGSDAKDAWPLCSPGPSTAKPM